MAIGEMKLEQQAREQAKQAKAMQKAKAQQRKLAQQQMDQQKAKLAQQRQEQQKEQHVQILSRRSRPVSHAHALTKGSPATGQSCNEDTRRETSHCQTRIGAGHSARVCVAEGTQNQRAASASIGALGFCPC